MTVNKKSSYLKTPQALTQTHTKMLMHEANSSKIGQNKKINNHLGRQQAKS